MVRHLRAITPVQAALMTEAIPCPNWSFENYFDDLDDSNMEEVGVGLACPPDESEYFRDYDRCKWMLETPYYASLEKELEKPKDSLVDIVTKKVDAGQHCNRKNQKNPEPHDDSNSADMRGDDELTCPPRNTEPRQNNSLCSVEKVRKRKASSVQDDGNKVKRGRNSENKNQLIINRSECEPRQIIERTTVKKRKILHKENDDIRKVRKVSGNTILRAEKETQKNKKNTKIVATDADGDQKPSELLRHVKVTKFIVSAM